jgi:hypothetical protein
MRGSFVWIVAVAHKFLCWVLATLAKLSALGALGALIVFACGVWQYWQAQQWKRLEFVADQMAKFFSDSQVKTAMRLLDYSRIRLAADGSRAIGSDGGTVFDDALCIRSLCLHTDSPDQMEDLPPEEMIAREAFDAFLTRLENLNHFIATKLIKPTDLEPYLSYWLTILADPTKKWKPYEFYVAMHRFITGYGYSGVQDLLEKVGGISLMADEEPRPDYDKPHPGEKPRSNTDVIEVRRGVKCDAANYIYYFQVGVGHWTGTFDFALTDRTAFAAAELGMTNRLLAISMHCLIRLFGKAAIQSHITGQPNEGVAGVARNLVIIRKFGITLYRLQEHYILQPNGRDVWVKSQERFGPIPFLLNNRKQHPAEILDHGMASVYYIPLLGAQWIGRYTVRQDCNHIESTLTCPWAVAHEVIDRVS